MIEAGADVNAPSGEKGLTPLMLIAIHKKSVHREQHVIEGAEPGEIANLLIAKGAEVNATDTADETALMFAAANNNAAMIGLLIQAGADPLAVASDDRVALDIARENRHDEAEKALRLFTPRKKSEAQ
ncbi:ankyrin repeat domain-containing protein [Enterovibrio coralii]|uniref:Uncharacterized protein n=1 Tax=Enterovibrio coralii TaxID=294935 RepID=A0A135IAB3_9GAMM|nr:ankyrin repeat domain-containing protein [Enterovibrio coralii]KXF82338.1 hypothetical protein ATN88_09265 [Enterovibrio coralii]